MIGLLQRVSEAYVEVGGERIARIGAGLLVLVGIERSDDSGRAARLLERILTYRVFPDAEGRMNLNLVEVGGGLLLVPQFTLAADTASGTRASFTPAMPPEQARPLFEALVLLAKQGHRVVDSGRFGADMQVGLVNDGPVSFIIEAR
ncbi:MAG: D-aminoacyl-tRNA deacylase [Nevskiales bacterium]